MLCPNCGKWQPDDAAFCGDCRHVLAPGRPGAVNPLDQTRGEGLPAGVAPSPPAYQARPGERVVRIGRGDHNEIVLDKPMVSWDHALIVIRDDGAFLCDLRSRNGTGLNRPENKLAPFSFVPLTAADKVFFGSFGVSADRLLPPRPENEVKRKALSLRQMDIDFRGAAMVLGRDPQCEIPLDFPMISWRHARLERSGDGAITITDLHSSNGTFVNRQRIRGRAMVRPGDVIGLGSYTFTLMADGKLKKKEYRGDVTIEASEICVKVDGGRKTLVENISLTIYPQELVALIGASGAGKTTFLKTLNRYTKPSCGKVLFNGQDLEDCYDQYRMHLGYVPQDDIMHRELTVRQALFYTAKLRLPPDTTRAEIDRRVQKVLEEMELTDAKDVIIGSAEKKGISGGQRKRVNIAMELLAEPSVLLLDEPTSGLSSEDSYMVVRLLRKLADSGKTIIATIHSPGPKVFRLFDNLALIYKDAGSRDPGRLIYYGPANPESILFFNEQNETVQKMRSAGFDPHPEFLLEGVKALIDPEDENKGAHHKTVDWEREYRASRYWREYVTERAEKDKPVAGPRQAPKPVDPVAQFLTLARRNLAVKLKDRVNTLILLLQAPVIALLVMFIFGGQTTEMTAPNVPGVTAESDFYAIDVSDMDTRQFATAEEVRNELVRRCVAKGDEWKDKAMAYATICFLMAVAAVWFGCSNSAREIVSEIAIFHREKMVNLRTVPYVASKFAVLGGLCLLQCLSLMLVLYYGCNLKGNVVMVFLLLFLCAMVGVACGLTLSAFARTSEVAIALLPLVVLPMVILGGMMQPVHLMGPGLKAFVTVMPTRWGFEGLFTTEAAEQPCAPESDQEKVKAKCLTAYQQHRPGDIFILDPKTGRPHYFKLPKDPQLDMAMGFFPRDSRWGPFAAAPVLLVLLGLLTLAVGKILSKRKVT